MHHYGGVKKSRSRRCSTRSAENSQRLIFISNRKTDKVAFSVSACKSECQRILVSRITDFVNLVETSFLAPLTAKNRRVLRTIRNIRVNARTMFRRFRFSPIGAAMLLFPAIHAPRVNFSQRSFQMAANKRGKLNSDQ